MRSLRKPRASPKVHATVHRMTDQGKAMGCHTVTSDTEESTRASTITLVKNVAMAAAIIMVGEIREAYATATRLRTKNRPTTARPRAAPSAPPAPARNAETTVTTAPTTAAGIAALF